MAKEVLAVAEEIGLIAQAQAEYEAIRAQIAEYYQQARELRNQADKLKQSGRTDVQVMTKVNQLLDQAERLTSLADQLDDNVYLHMFYRNGSEPKGISYTLRLETRPEYYFQFKEVLDKLRRAASDIYYVNCDVAYDVQAPMNDVVVFLMTDGER